MPKVLVVDDSLSVRKVVERALTGCRIDVVLAASGTEALECIERESPDVVVCDVVMPDRDGYDICAFVKNHPRLGATPVLLMSGIVNDEVRIRADAARSAGVLAKPFAADDLLRHLEVLLANGTAVAPAQAPAAPVRAPAAPVSAPVAPTQAPTAPVAVPTARIRAAATSALEAPARSPMGPPPVAPVRSVVGLPPTAATPSPPTAGAASPRGADGVRAVLDAFAKMDGVQWAVVTDREGFVIEATSHSGVDADVAAALSACLAESSEGLGRELGRGGLAGMILEYDKGIVVLYGVGTAALFAVGLTDAATLGKVRYYVKKAVADLGRMV